MPQFQVGNRVRCIRGARNPNLNESLILYTVYEVTVVSPLGISIKVEGFDTNWKVDRFELVNNAVRVPIPNPQVAAPARRTSVKFIVVDDWGDWYVFDTEEEAQDYAERDEDDGNPVQAVKKVTLTLR